MMITKIKFEHISLKIHKILLLMNILAVIIFSMGLVYFTLDQGNTIHIFSMTIMGIAAIIYMPVKVSAPLIIISTIVFCMSIASKNQHTIDYIFSLNTVIFNGLALALSINIFSMKNRELMNMDKLAKQNNHLEKKAKLDQMTNLLNHEAILNILAKEMFFKSRYQEELIIMLLDIDDFKKINDTFGHSEEGAHSVYQRFRDMLIDKYQGKGYQITLSCGMARYKIDQSINDLINLADKRLYKAKQTGKDKCVYDE